MRIFKGKSDSFDSFGSMDPSALCPACYKAFEACFKKDKPGRIDLDFSHQPKLCDSCKRKMKEQFGLSRYPDRG